MKMTAWDISYGREFTAAWTLVNSPEVASLGLTTIAPLGGYVREPRAERVGIAETLYDEDERKRVRRNVTSTLELRKTILMTDTLASRTYICTLPYRNKLTTGDMQKNIYWCWHARADIYIRDDNTLDSARMTQAKLRFVQRPILDWKMYLPLSRIKRTEM